jgi:hypothetical protein
MGLIGNMVRYSRVVGFLILMTTTRLSGGEIIQGDVDLGIQDFGGMLSGYVGGLEVSPEVSLMYMPKVMEVEMPLVEDNVAGMEIDTVEEVVDNILDVGIGYIDYDDRYLMEAVVWAEARGEGDIGMELVADVILNRVKDDQNFPNTIRGVISANNGITYQFCGFGEGGYLNYPEDGIAEVRNAVVRALDGSQIARGATFFRTVAGMQDSWHERVLIETFIHNRHFFGKV